MKEHDKHSPLKPGAQKLSSIWKRFAVSAALATVLVTGCASIQPNPTEPDDAPLPQRTELLTDTVKPPPPPVRPHHVAPAETSQQKALREFARHVLVRRALLNDARQHFAEIAQLSRTAYSDRLDSLQQRLNGTLQADPAPINSSVFILDPRQFDVGQALGFTAQKTIEGMLKSGKVGFDKDIVESAAGNMSGSYVTPYGRVLAQEPSAFMNTAGAATAGVCILVPSSDFALPYSIPGLTPLQMVSLINGHESWHCLDSRYSLAGIDPKQVEKELKSNLPLLTGPAVRDYVSIMHHKEALGDVGIVGDMIRQQGMDTTLIDRVIAWREQQRDEITHVTSPALRELKARVEGMGLEAFRALDDTAAHDIYFTAVDNNTLSARQIKLVIFMSLAEKGDYRASLDSFYAGDADYQRAVDFSRYINLKETPSPPHGLPASMRPLTADEQAVWKQIVGYDAGQALQDKAFALGSKITPATMVAAYGEIQNGLLGNIRENPTDPAQPLLMAKLQQVFIHDLQNIDYLQVNRDRGVDIVSVEPSLVKFRLPGQPVFANTQGTPRAPGS